jgi:hypothetical protein
MSGDRYRPLTAAAVLLVAAIAAVVSYMHVATLALAYGQPPLAAYLARTGLVLAVVATLAANVASGAAHGWPGALLAGWPAVAFVVSAETAISMSRRRVASGQRSEQERPAATHRAHARPKVVTRRPAAADTEAAILATLATRPDMTNADLAGAARGVHPDSPPLPVPARTRGQRPPNRISPRGGVLA